MQLGLFEKPSYFQIVRWARRHSTLKTPGYLVVGINFDSDPLHRLELLKQTVEAGICPTSKIVVLLIKPSHPEQWLDIPEPKSHGSLTEGNFLF